LFQRKFSINTISRNLFLKYCQKFGQLKSTQKRKFSLSFLNWFAQWIFALRNGLRGIVRAIAMENTGFGIFYVLFEVVTVPLMSSVVYFHTMLKMPWRDSIQKIIL